MGRLNVCSPTVRLETEIMNHALFTTRKRFDVSLGHVIQGRVPTGFPESNSPIFLEFSSIDVKRK